MFLLFHSARKFSVCSVYENTELLSQKIVA